MTYTLAKMLCDVINLQSGFEAALAETKCRNAFGTDSMRGRISIAENEYNDCYICFYSNPSGRVREAGIAFHINRDDEMAQRIAESIMKNISVSTNVKPIGVYKSRDPVLSEGLSVPIIAELSFNPYGAGYTGFCEEIKGLPEIVFSGIKQVFEEGERPTDYGFQEYLNENSGNGFLKVQVSAGRSEIPVPDARIVVTKKLNGKAFVLAGVISDINGMTQRISLPAPPASLSQTPGNINPFAVYDVEISRPGYVTVKDIDVPVFDKVLSIQNVKLNSESFGNGEV